MVYQDIFKGFKWVASQTRRVLGVRPAHDSLPIAGGSPDSNSCSKPGSVKAACEKDSDDSDEEADDDPDDESDAESVTSTIKYEQQPFTEFEPRASALARPIWPNVSAGDITVERMEGGYSNRITRITVDDKISGSKAEYILRNPRFDSMMNMEDDVTPLVFLERHTTILAPRLSRINLSRKTAARELAGIYRQLLETRNAVPGFTVFPEDDRSVQASVLVWPFDPLQTGNLDRTFPVVRDRLSATPYSNSAPAQHVGGMLVEALKSRQAALLASGRQFEAAIDGKLLGVASDMHAEGWFDNVGYSFVNRDLVPHNIIEWLDDDDDDDDDTQRNEYLPEPRTMEEPETPEARELKQIFDDAAGPEYVRFAYNPVYRLARALIVAVLDGMDGNEPFQRAMRMVAEWSKRKQEIAAAEDPMDLFP
ncbi:hypothetical protein B0H66DRAFT_630683 [Apodospora peruviana]|uniref:Aminoglycoside phosphotransferase domain-containing protein n=1 Tax=Apodospora peruviana TaxID=516989 RepID=A0AAE0HX53_9PEZI|nr:hypothetical protein B0H66DRAFT_630683 [Apodospora peruviana]